MTAYASTGELVPADERVRRCLALRDAGVRAVKLRLDAGDWRADVEVLAAVRDAVGDRLEIMVDANQGWRMPGDLTPRWSRETALEFAREVERFDVYWLEEPLPTEDVEGYAALRRSTGLRIAAGEMIRSAPEARALVAGGGVDVVQTDVVLAGGIEGCRRVAELVSGNGTSWSPHTWSNGYGLVANLHAALAFSTCPYIEVPYDPPGWGPERARLAAAGYRSRSRPTAPSRLRRARARDRAGLRRARGLPGRVMRIRAAVLREPGTPVRVEEVELDPPKAGEVLVRVAAAGVCHSDVLLADGELGPGRWPMVLGHEGAGVVEEVGEGVTHVAPGDPVGFCIVPACRTCAECARGRFHLCIPAGENGPRGTLLDGTSRLRLPDGTPLQHGLMTACFAERTVVAAASAVPLPAGLPLWQASLLGCGVVTGFGAVRNVGRVEAGESVAVIGCGGVGLQVLAAARLAGADPLIAVDLDAGKLELALARGATHTVESGSATTAERVKRLTDGGVEHAFEVVGRPETMRLAWDVLRSGGTAVVVGLAPVGVEVALPAIEFLSDKGILGSYYGSGDAAAALADVAGLALAGELDLAGVVSQVDTARRRRGRARTARHGTRASARCSPSTPTSPEPAVRPTWRARRRR